MTTAALVDRLAAALDSSAPRRSGRAKTGRRGFLARTAVVGSALAARPVAYVLEPGTAYAAVCNCKGSSCDCGSACCDGYTEFCCTLDGHNRCPPNTVVAGWWKADTAPQFCGGPRYYLDCNAPCGGCGCGANGLCSGGCSGTGCGCAGGDCNNRASGCNLFRYGQCNAGIPCVGPIVCRIVTCVPPWAIEPTCTTVSRVDEYTAFHDRPCLHQVTGHVDVVAPAGNVTRVLGWALDYDTASPVTVQAFVNGRLVASARAGDPRPDVAHDYPGWGGGHGFHLDIPHPGPSHSVCVLALNEGWDVGPVDLGCHAVAERTTGSPWGGLDIHEGGQRSVRVAGWVVDPDRPEATAVHAYVGGRFAGSAVANLNRPDIARVHPRAGGLHGFDFTVPAPGGRQEVCIYGLNAGDGSPNALIGCRTVTVSDGQPFGRVDHCAAMPGTLHIRGWAMDPDSADPVPVDVYADDTLIGRVRAGLDRPDIGRAFPGQGDAHGFEAFLPLGGGRHRIRTYAVDIAGSDANALFDERHVQSPTGPPFGYMDICEARPGGIRVAGWTIDPDGPGPVDIHVWADGDLLGTARADAERTDVGRQFLFHGARHGYDTVVPAPPGFHVVRVYALNQGLPDGNTLLGTGWVVVA